MSDTFKTLRQPDAEDMKALLIGAKELAHWPPEELQAAMAAALRLRLDPNNRTADDDGVESVTSETVAETTEVAASMPTVRNFTLPEHLGAGTLRTVVRNGAAWFVAADVANVLGYKHAPHMVRMLDTVEAAVHKMDSRSTNGVQQARDVTIISESGLYTVILNSQRETARPFRSWVTKKVLPAIARTGRFQAEPGEMDAHMRTATHGQVGIAPNAAQVAAGLPSELQLLLTMCMPMLVELAPHLQGWVAAWLDQRTRAMLPRTTPHYTDAAWFDLLNANAKLRGRANVARELGVSAPQVSQVLNGSGKYGDGRASTHVLAEKVLQKFAAQPHEPAQASLI